eukprot:TRINITY_DN25989_c0_g1_i1.p1 TRINITY_DN25989_c0_g1~~TRINITY_DN25989_c0_g1_i1.p1  ORF type:complete len:486 (-),score=97.10 TRINITY_DN25989_c0_g1_i1:168-1625(-)
MAAPRTALLISGRTDRHEFINDTYEPMTMQHNGRSVWVARSVAPRYLYHSGKTRWVLSKQLDDGARCWAFITASSSSQSPLDATGSWTCCDKDGSWRPDPRVTCVAVKPSTDKFVQLRLTLDDEMEKLGLNSNKALKQMWRRLDYNGNNIVSLAEIDKMVVELIAGGTWPSWLNNKPALMRAYKKTILKDGDGDDWVEKKEFHALLLNIFWFNRLWQIYDVVDTGDDRRINVREFVSGMGQLGLHMSQQEAEAEFAKIDGNKGGQVLFVEFCAYVRKRVNPDSQSYFDADITSGVKASSHIRKQHGDKATHGVTVKQKSFRHFDALEQKIQASVADRKKIRRMWHVLDFNGNNIVSLAEIDKWVVQQYPLLNHKPALMRAYKATIAGGNHDDWVHTKDFKRLIANLFYFNKLYWVFDQANGDDRRITLQEFKFCLTMCGCTMNDSDARREFNYIDKNHGGIILFDEFCAWFASKRCPEAMTDLVD